MKPLRMVLFCLSAVAIGYALRPSLDAMALAAPGTPQCFIAGNDVPIPDDGSWLEICVVGREAPVGATIAEVNVRLLLDHPEPAQLEMALTKADTDVIVPMSLVQQWSKSFGEVARSHAFDGLPAQPEWILRVRDTVPGGQGRVTDALVRPLYSSDLKATPTATKAVKTPTAAQPASPSPVRTMGPLELHIQTIEEYLTPTPLGTPQNGYVPPGQGSPEAYRTDAGLVCNRGLCIGLEIAQPVHAAEPALATVTLVTEADTTGVQMSLSSIFSGILQGPIESPEGATMVRQEERFIFWSMDTVGGEAYTFSAYVLYDRPTATEGADRFEVIALATHVPDAITVDLVALYLDTAGNQVEPTPRVPVLLPITMIVQTYTPAAFDTPVAPRKAMSRVVPWPSFTVTAVPTAVTLTTARPTITARPTATPRPTWTPTPTPLPTPTRTLTPTRMMGHPARSPAVTPTVLRDYPEP